MLMLNIHKSMSWAVYISQCIEYICMQLSYYHAGRDDVITLSIQLFIILYLSRRHPIPRYLQR